MKHYFDFLLTGKKLLPVWLLFYLLVLVPYLTIIFLTQQHKETVSPWLFLFVAAMILGTFVFYFYMGKLCIEHTRYDEQPLLFSGKFSSYFGKVLLGTFLSIITLGVYIAWFTRNIMSFFVDNTTLNGSPLTFKGKGVVLFVILLLLMIPVMILSFVVGLVFALKGVNVGAADAGVATALIQILSVIIMIPYMYLVYKWMVDVEYKGYRIRWDTRFWPSCLQILIQIVLTIITLGIYLPMAYLKLYNYFVGKTVAESQPKKLSFGYELDASGDFLFVWGQLLLSIITLGMYYPWAICKIGKRVLSKTYSQVTFELPEYAVTPPPIPL